MVFSVVCVSDSCAAGVNEDRSGPVISEMLSSLGEPFEYLVVPDEKERISEALTALCDRMKSGLIVTTGGTGFAPRDVTPEATKAIIEREVPGIPEAIRAKSLEITPRAMLSRATAGIRGGTLIINLPGSPKAVRESLEVVLPVLPHALETLAGNTHGCGGNYGKE